MSVVLGGFREFLSPIKNGLQLELNTFACKIVFIMQIFVIFIFVNRIEMKILKTFGNILKPKTYLNYEKFCNRFLFKY